MRFLGFWENEYINWIDPRDESFKEARRDGLVREPIGLTPNQMSHRAGSFFQVLRYMPPGEFLDLVDPLFDPSGSKSIDYFELAVDAGHPFAPLQVWLSFDEYLYWPHVGRGTDWRDEEIRTRIRRGQEVSSDEHRRIVRSHEGRHRAWFAQRVGLEGETEIPVTVWIGES